MNRKHTQFASPAPAFRRRSWRAFLAVTAYGIALFWINHIPQIGVSLGGGKDKYAHFGAYGLLSFLIAWGFFPERRGTARGYALIFLMSAAYGAMDELLQTFVPNRSAEWQDWFADLSGAGLALLAHCLLAPPLGRIRRWLTPQWLWPQSREEAQVEEAHVKEAPAESREAPPANGTASFNSETRNRPSAKAS